MLQFSHNDDYAKSIAIPWVLSEESQAKNKLLSIHSSNMNEFKIFTYGERLR